MDSYNYKILPDDDKNVSSNDNNIISNENICAVDIDGESLKENIDYSNAPMRYIVLQNIVPDNLNTDKSQSNKFYESKATQSDKYDLPELDQDCANDLYTILNEWNFQHLYNIFLSECIDLTAMRTLSTDHLLYLSSKRNIKLGDIIKFEQKLKIWQNSMKTTVSGSCSSIEENSIKIVENLPTHAENIKDNMKFELESVLLQNPQGKFIIDYFKKHNQLNDGCRIVLLEIINNHLIQNEIKMTMDLAKLISEKIIDLFKSENLGMYYVKQDGKRAISKVYAKYFNSMRVLRNCGLIQKRSYSCETSDPKNCIRIHSILEKDSEENIENSLISIRENNLSFAELLIHWSATKILRCKEIAEICMNFGKGTSNIIHAWPQYKNAMGFKLMEIDFECVFGKTEFLKTFENERTKLISILKERVKDIPSKELLSKISDDISENGQNMIMVYLLHALLPPISRAVLKTSSNSKKSCIKFSIKDSQNAMFIVCKSVADIEEKIADKQDEALPIQPFIIVEGEIWNPTGFILYFDGIKYKFECVLKSIDICFKIHMLFNLEYSSASILVWNFIQQHYYKIKTKFDMEHPVLITLLDKFSN